MCSAAYLGRAAVGFLVRGLITLMGFRCLTLTRSFESQCRSRSPSTVVRCDRSRSMYIHVTRIRKLDGKQTSRTAAKGFGQRNWQIQYIFSELLSVVALAKFRSTGTHLPVLNLVPRSRWERIWATKVADTIYFFEVAFGRGPTGTYLP